MMDKFRRMKQEEGWEVLIKEHRYRTGPVFRTCSVYGFDFLFATPDGPTLVEVTDDGNRASHRKRILEKIEECPLLLSNFRIQLAIYYGGHRRLDRRTDGKWTKSGTWVVEEINSKPSWDFKCPNCASQDITMGNCVVTDGTDEQPEMATYNCENCDAEFQVLIEKKFTPYRYTDEPTEDLKCHCPEQNNQ